MALNKQLQNVRDQIFLDEIADTEQWNRAKVEECIKSVVIMARRFSPYDPEVAKFLSEWPEDSSVRYEWFRYIAKRPEIKILDNQLPLIDSMENVYSVLTQWLHRIDSNMERVVFIMHAAGVSFDNIAKAFPNMRWKRQTLSRKHTKRLNDLVYDLNRIDHLKYPSGKILSKYI